MVNKSFVIKSAYEHFKKKEWKIARDLYREAGEIVGFENVKANLLICEKRINEYTNINSAIPFSMDATSSKSDAESFVKESLRKYGGDKSFESFGSINDLPKVSIVVTSYNAVRTIERSIDSLLFQNYPNLEVVVCDDMSTDGTWDVLKRLQNQSNGALKIIRVNVNGGTYLAKNIAVAESTGDIIMFQDSDDYSHPDRVLVQVLPLIKNKGLVATRSKYLRFDPLSKKIIQVSGLYSRVGYITIAVIKSIFNEIGYFDAVRRAGDDEWVRRLLHLYGNSKVLNLEVTLYLAELRHDSLAADINNLKPDGSVEQAISEPRKEYVNIFKSRFFKNHSAEWYKNNFGVYPLRLEKNYPESIRALDAPQDRVYAAVCFDPSRAEGLKELVGRILPQVDELFVCIDKLDTVPDFIVNRYKVTVIKLKDDGVDCFGNANLIVYNHLKVTQEDFYYFTFDDGVIYPYDYVRSIICRLNMCGNKVVAGVHGIVYDEKVKGGLVYHFEKTDLHAPRLVNALGAGMLAFHSECMDYIDLNKFGVEKNGGVSKLCRELNIPMLCVDRHSGWLRSIDNSSEVPHLMELAQEIVGEYRDEGVRGYQSIAEVVFKKRFDGFDCNEFLPNFFEDISASGFYQRRC